VRPGQLFVEGVLEPLLGCMVLALGTGAVATGMVDAVLLTTAVALRAAVAVMAAVARLDGTDNLAVCEGQMGGALQVLRGTGGADVAAGGHGRSPCMRVVRRA
jgi:hypothetical protein